MKLIKRFSGITTLTLKDVKDARGPLLRIKCKYFMALNMAVQELKRLGITGLDK